MLGSIVTVTVDRPLGSRLPEYPELYHSINYGYVERVIAADGEEQDAYSLGVDETVEKFIGKIIEIVHRKGDVEGKRVVVSENASLSEEEIREQIHFQEQYSDSEIIM